jgi:dihydroxyacetone kinase-like protein
MVGMTLVSSIGGASGPLYGTFFLRFGTACGPRADLSADDVVKAFRAGVEGLVARGKPELGDKTMFDSLHPALEALDAAIGSGLSPEEAFAAAWQAAERGRDDTVPMVARKGRASYLGERSAGHQDPGATSAALLFEAAAKVFEP